MDASPTQGSRDGKPSLTLAKAPEAATVIPGLVQAAVILLPGIPGPLRMILLIIITTIALGYGLHLANYLKSQTPLKIVAFSTLSAFSFVVIAGVPMKDWVKLKHNITCVIFDKCVDPTPKQYFVKVHLFQDDDGDNMQGAFDKDLPNTYVSLTYMVGQKPQDVGGYTDDRGIFNQVLDGPHDITVKSCGIAKDDDGNRSLQVTSDNDAPALSLTVNIGIDPNRYKECVHYPAS